MAKASRRWRDWLPLWALWALSTSAGGLLGWLLVGAFGTATSWAPGEVEAHLRSPWMHLCPSMLFGAIFGAGVGILVALYRRLALRRSPSDVAKSVVATIVGGILLCVTTAVGPGQVESDFVTGLRSGLVGGAIGGAFSGACQWFLLRRRVGRPDGWVLATAAGWAIGWAIIWALRLPSAAAPSIAWRLLYLAAALAGGAVSGLGQWLILRRSVRGAAWWVLAAAVSWGGVFWLSELGSAMAVVFAGLVTATALVWLLHRPRFLSICPLCPPMLQ